MPTRATQARAIERRGPSAAPFHAFVICLAYSSCSFLTHFPWGVSEADGRFSQQRIVECECPLELRNAGKLLGSDLSSTFTHRVGTFWIAKYVNYSICHLFIIAGWNDESGFTFDDCFTRAADVCDDYGPRGGHIFENGIRETFSLRTEHTDI